MIAFASAVTSDETYQRCAVPGIRRAAEPDALVIARPATGSIFSGYNAILDEAAEVPGLEALVLLHQDAEIVEEQFCPKVRAALADPQVGVVGCAGAIGVRSLAWWEGSLTWAAFTHRHEDFGGGYSPSYTWAGSRPAFAQLGEVDSVDGVLMVLSPWAVRSIRFDEMLGQMLHGYDLDYCLQVREAGRKVATADLQVIHHHAIYGSDAVTWKAAHLTIAEKWSGRMPGFGEAPGTWRERARRAEAEAAIVRAASISHRLRVRAMAHEYPHERTVMETSLGWRMTAPLRRLWAMGRVRSAS